MRKAIVNRNKRYAFCFFSSWNHWKAVQISGWEMQKAIKVLCVLGDDRFFLINVISIHL